MSAIDPDDWRNVLRRFPGVSDAGIDQHAAPGGFSGAVVRRVVSDGRAFALRAWPQYSLPKPRILGLHELLRSIAAKGHAFVAVPMGADDGSTLVEHAGRFWQVEPWLPGAADYRASPSPAKLRAAAHALAAWHLAAAPSLRPIPRSPGFFSQRSAPSPAVEERLALLETLIERDAERISRELQKQPHSPFRELAAQLLTQFWNRAEALRTELQLGSRERLALQPCLRDVWHDHVLFTGDEVTGIIDPSACRSENVATDLARLFGSLVGNDRAGWRIAVDAYAERRPLTPQERALVEVLDRSGVLLSGMRWLVRICLERADPLEMARVMARLGEIVSRLAGSS